MNPQHPESPSRFPLAKPPVWFAIAATALMVGVMAYVRLDLYANGVLPIGYGLPLLMFVWIRSRPLLWIAVASFLAMSIIKLTWWLKDPSAVPLTGSLLAFGFIIVQLDLFVIAFIVDALVTTRARLEHRNAELRRNNAQLETINRELAAREEEIARQNEELQSQTEELERQTEELRVANEELRRRERVTETLLSLSRGLTTELTREEMMARICEVLGHLIEGAADGSAILEVDGPKLAIRCHQGFGADGPREDGVSVERSFAAMVMSRGRTAYIEDLSQRPDIPVPQPRTGAPFAAVIATPLRAMGWPVGTLELYRRRPGPWSDDDVTILESLAAQASISLEALQQVQQVQQERRRFETVLRSAPVGIAVCNAERTEVRLNWAAATLLGVPADTNYMQEPTAASAVTYQDGRIITPDQWPLSRAAREGIDVHATELEVVLPTGRRISMLINATPIRDATGSPNGAVATFIDITGMKDLQRELDTRRREAEEASVRKTRFLAAVSHDIRTPANAITLLAELIRRTAANPALAGEVPELAKEIHASALSLVELLGDVLDLARYDSGRLEMQESEFSLAELLDDEHRRFAPLAREKGLTLVVTAPDKPLRIRTDRIKLSRVIGNLVGNAIKFTPSGEVRIEALGDGAETNGDGTNVSPVIRVRDTGIGIEQEHQKNIFDEFVQLHNRERDRNKGTGLGLTICKRLVEAIGGSLSLNSEPGKGSTFTVTLPPDSVVH